MRLGNLKRSVGQDSKVGCVLDIPFRYVEAAHQGYFMSRDVYGHRCQNFGSVWNLDGRKFDGIDDYVDCGNDESLSVISAVTVEVRAKYGALGEHQVLQGKRTGDYAGYTALKGTDDKIHFLLADSSSAWKFDIKSDDSILLEWIHIVGTYQSGNGLLYINGVQQRETSSATNNIYEDGGNLAIGGEPVNPHWVNGLISEIRIYNLSEYFARMLQRAIRARRN